MLRFGPACAAVALLAACANPPEPIEPESPATTAARPSARPASAPPTMPAIANRRDEVGAANFVLYWVNVSNYAANTGDTDLLRKISAPDCEGCNRYIDLYEKTYAAGGYFRDGDRTPQEISVEALDRMYVTTLLAAASGAYRESRQSKEHLTRSEQTRVTFALVRRSASWQVADVGLATS